LGDYVLNSLKNFKIEANGHYGLDAVGLRDSATAELVTIPHSIVAAVETTQFYNGLFGLGITTSNFVDKHIYSPFTMMVADLGHIPSYTYGFTAGAYYRNGGTSHSSLVLGGYDQNRFEPHNIEFRLQRNEDRLPQALVRGIEVSVKEEALKPDVWSSNPQILSRMNESFVAVIDSSTPFIHVPDSVIRHFVENMQLTWNKAVEAYIVNDDQRTDLLKEDMFSFTFSLSSFDNTDNFGSPLEVDGVVNITLPGAAFVHLLRYPYNDEAIAWGAPSQPFFPIKRAEDDKFILGRTFLQEAYLLTKYDSEIFSIHQAKHPSNPAQFDIKAVAQPMRSDFPPPKSRQESGGLTKSQMIGIVCGTVVVCLIGLFAFFFCCQKRRKARKAMAMAAFHDTKDAESSIMEETPRTPVARIFSKILRRKQSRKSEPDSEAAGTESNPAEVGADATHEVYELSAPLPAVELDADTGSVHDVEIGEVSTQDGGYQRYEVARRRIERALAGPVPAYSPPANDGAVEDLGEKGMQDVSPVETYRPGDRGLSPTPSPTHTHATSNQSALPSPMSPHPDWGTRMPDVLPSPMTNAHPYPFPALNGSGGANSGPTVSSRGATSFDPSSMSRSNSSDAAPSPTSATSMVPPSPIFQRTPIDPSRIICLGPLPENVQVPSPTNTRLPRLVGPDGQPLQLPGTPLTPNHAASNGADSNLVGPNPMGSNAAARLSTDTLGSNFTDIEEQMMTQQQQHSPTRTSHSPISPSAMSPISGSLRRLQMHPPVDGEDEHRLESPRSQERIDTGSELIHVPQLAERRYSWEEDR
jgi:hypothetical protein